MGFGHFGPPPPPSPEEILKTLGGIGLRITEDAILVLKVTKQNSPRGLKV